MRRLNCLDLNYLSIWKPWCRLLFLFFICSPRCESASRFNHSQCRGRKWDGWHGKYEIESFFLESEFIFSTRYKTEHLSRFKWRKKKEQTNKYIKKSMDPAERIQRYILIPNSLFISFIWHFFQRLYLSFSVDVFVVDIPFWHTNNH